MELHEDKLLMLGEEDLSEKMKAHEKIGDCAANIQQYKLALKHYGLMVRISEIEKQFYTIYKIDRKNG